MAAPAAQSAGRVELALEGMTRAACATRIERKLNRLEGVEASVNYATEQASVRYDPARAALDDLLGAIEAAGYRARLAADAERADGRARTLRIRLAAAVLLSAPLTAVAMIPPLQFSGWEWLALALATPVVFWAGSGFHRAAQARRSRPRSGAAGLDGAGADHGRGTVRKMRQNLGWAIGYNSLALPIAAGVLEPWGLTLRPEIAAISMSGSSILVAVNAVSPKRLRLPSQAG